MDENEKIILKKRMSCSIIGGIALILYLIPSFEEINYKILFFRLTIAVIAVIVYSIKLGIEISSKKEYSTSILLILICFYFIMNTAYYM